MVTVYTTGPACVQCTATKRWLNKAGVSFVEVNVLLHPAEGEAVKSLGYTQSPVVLAGDAHWSGFNPDLLALHTLEAA